jgi:hypothetical protein
MYAVAARRVISAAVKIAIGEEARRWGFVMELHYAAIEALLVKICEYGNAGGGYCSPFNLESGAQNQT